MFSKYGVPVGAPPVYTHDMLPDATAVPDGFVVWNSTYEVLLRSNGTRWMALSPFTVYAKSPNDVITGTTSLTAFRDVLIPGGLVGKNGHLRIEPLLRYTSNGNAKNPSIRISSYGGVVSGSQLWAHSQASTSTASFPYIVHNDNSETAQVAATAGATNGSVGQSTAAGEVTAAIDTTADFYITIAATPASAGDTLTLRRLAITVFPKYN